MQPFFVFYKLNCCGWWPSLPGPWVEQSVLRAWCPCYVCDAQGATAYHHPANWHVPLQMWPPAVLPSWHWQDKGMEVANKDWREDVISAAFCLLDPNTLADELRTWWIVGYEARMGVGMMMVHLGGGCVSSAEGNLFWCQHPWDRPVESASASLMVDVFKVRTGGTLEHLAQILALILKMWTWKGNNLPKATWSVCVCTCVWVRKPKPGKWDDNRDLRLRILLYQDLNLTPPTKLYKTRSNRLHWLFTRASLLCS